MKTLSLISILSIIILSACSSTHFVEHNEKAYTELNKALEGKKALIKFENEQTVTGKNIEVTPDSTSWIDSKQNKQVISTLQVKEVSINSQAKGAGKGLIAGSLLGIPAGACIGEIGRLLFADKRYRSKYYFGHGARVGAILGFLTGWLPGIVVGASKGSTDRYIISIHPDSIITSINIDDLPVSRVGEETRIFISGKVGEIIDQNERNKYKLFPGISGFQSAILLKLPDGGYSFKITHLDAKTGEEKTTLLLLTESEIRKILDHINRFNKR